jgi:O-antigen/teichoic acid export membrane protein
MIGATSSSSLVVSSKNFESEGDREAITLSGSAVLFASAFGNGLNYAFGIFLARMLGAEDFGLYALAVTIFNMVTLTVVFGLDVGTIKFVSHHLVIGQHAKARESVIAATSLAFGSGLLAAIGLGLLAHPIALTFYNKPGLVLGLLAFALAVPLATVASVAISASQAFQTVQSTILIKYLWEPIAKFVFASVAIWAGFQLLGVLISIVLTLTISAALAIRAAYRLVVNGSGGVFVWNRQEVSWRLVLTS